MISLDKFGIKHNMDKKPSLKERFILRAKTCYELVDVKHDVVLERFIGDIDAYNKAVEEQEVFEKRVGKYYESKEYTMR